MLSPWPVVRDVRLEALVGRLADRAHGRGAPGRPPSRPPDPTGRTTWWPGPL